MYSFYHDIVLYNDPATTELYTLSLHDALPISFTSSAVVFLSRIAARSTTDTLGVGTRMANPSSFPFSSGSTSPTARSEEHTSELQSHHDLVCRLLLEKKKTKLDESNAWLVIQF